MGDSYPHKGKSIYLVLLFHQHQPFYTDIESGKLVAPWVRTHSTKDYYRIPSILKKYPNVHLTINITPSLIYQLENYLSRLEKFVDHKNRIIKYNSEYPGVETLFDLLIKPTTKFSLNDIKHLYFLPFNALSVSEIVRHHFPEFSSIYNIFNKARKENQLITDRQLLRKLKFWFALVNFDLDILDGPIKLSDNTIIDLSDLIERKSDYKYYLKKEITESDCQHLAYQSYLLMKNVFLVHKKLRYDPERYKGQIELTTSPYSHPIIPLIYDSDIAKECMPGKKLPDRFNYPGDASYQVIKGIKTFKNVFGFKPNGMWPPEGAISQDSLKVFVNVKISWIATDMQILENSIHRKGAHLTPYRLNLDKKNIAIFFRDTDLSDNIGFKYQSWDGEEAADDFVKRVLSYADPMEEKVVSIILDGENAWEWYRRDFGAREFFNALFRKLEKLFQSRQIVTVTPSEYLNGNPRRNIPKHSIENLPHLKNLRAGSWIHADFHKWIGNEEKNQRWMILLKARSDLIKAGFSLNKIHRMKGEKNDYLLDAYDALLIAEGSDWFWWAGEDQEAYMHRPFDNLFSKYILKIYENLSKVDYNIKAPIEVLQIMQKEKQKFVKTQMGAIKSGRRLVTVKFICNAENIRVKDAIYITGNIEQLGEWIPNLIRMKKLESAKKTNEQLWTYEVQIPEGTEVQYKYTNSGKVGIWQDSEEFPALNRFFIVESNENNIQIIKDKFGKI